MLHFAVLTVAVAVAVGGVVGGTAAGRLLVLAVHLVVLVVLEVASRLGATSAARPRPLVAQMANDEHQHRGVDRLILQQPRLPLLLQLPIAYVRADSLEKREKSAFLIK